MKEFQIPWGAQAHFNLLTLRHNFRVFPRGKRKGYSPIQLEGLNISLNEWSDLLYSEDKASLKEALFFSGEGKRGNFLGRCLLTKKRKNVLTLVVKLDFC